MKTPTDLVTDDVLDLAARAGHEVNRAYCRACGDFSIPVWEDAPDLHRESLQAAARFTLENPGAMPDARHKSWLDRKLAEGWVYGPVKDAALKEHPCMRPFDELPVPQQLKDMLSCCTMLGILIHYGLISEDEIKG